MLRNGVSSAVIMPLAAHDREFLREMCYLAVFVPPGHEPPPRHIIDEPAVAVYIEDWGREHDMGFIAADRESGRRIGAVWLRLFSADHPGFGFVAPDIPELSLSVVPDRRGEGIGSMLLDAILEKAAARYAAVSLSVSKDNPACRLYQRAGFREVAATCESLIMVKELHRCMG